MNEEDKVTLFSKIYKSNFTNVNKVSYYLFLIHIPILFFDYLKYKEKLWISNLAYEYIFFMHMILYFFITIFLITFQLLKKIQPTSNIILYFSYIVSFFLQIWCAFFSAIEQKLFGDISIYIIALFGLPILFKFKSGLELFKFALTHTVFMCAVPIFQVLPNRTEGIWLNSTVAALLAFLASRISFSFKIGELTSYLIILKQKEELSIEKEKVKEATKSKNEFIANMSHEIQNQMSGVIGILQLLDSTKSDEEQKEYLNILDSSVKNLLTIMRDIIDFSLMEAGKTELQNKPFELPSLIKEILSISSSIASLNNNIVKSSIAANVPTHILGDRIRLSQILLNLLGNAVKFTKSGRIDLNVIVKEKKDTEITLEFEVKDTGIGIPQTKLVSIFEMYKNGDIPISQNYQGTGLGLAISKKLIEMMQGKIYAKSVEGKGTSFHFTMQSEDCGHLMEQKKDKLEQDISPKKLAVNTRKLPLKILLVDDNEINLKLGKKVFEKMGYDVKTAFDGSEAVESCQKNQFDIIFMDLRMPVMNGFEATELINKNKHSPTDKPLIIALSANATNADKDKCLQVGMVDLIMKPLDVSRIKDYLVYIIDKYNINH